VDSYLYRLTPYDLRVWSLAICLLLLAAAVGILIPALRASHIDPTRALRQE
jgi:ABC-type lipoprotein release transport system permease subunit